MRFRPFDLTTNDVSTQRILYDTDGEAVGFVLDETDLIYYEKDALGSVTGFVSNTKDWSFRLTYDAYGEMQIVGMHPLAAMLAKIILKTMVPNLYRGYPTVPCGGEFCYSLGTRFYYPKLGRFLNADIYEDTGSGVVGTNMYAYCNNNPVMFVDPEGTAALSSINTAAAIVFMLMGISYLNRKGYQIAAALYQHAFTGNGKPIKTGNLANRIISKVKKSPEFLMFLQKQISMSRSTSFNGYYSLEFVNGDLYYAFQHATLYVYGRQSFGKWNLRFALMDTYDFDEIRLLDKLSFANAANDFGYVLMRAGIMKVFDIYLEFQLSFRYVLNGVIYS